MIFIDLNNNVWLDTLSCSAWWLWRCKCLKFSNVPQSIVSKASYYISSPFALNLDMNRVFYEKKKTCFIFFSTSDVMSVDSYVCINFANPKGIHWEFYNEKILQLTVVRPTLTCKTNPSYTELSFLFSFSSEQIVLIDKKFTFHESTSL